MKIKVLKKYLKLMVDENIDDFNLQSFLVQYL
jgi:hypothetical protein